MKNWWLKLYTIPALKVLAKSTAIVFCSLLLLDFILPDLLFLGPYAIFYVGYTQFMQNKKGLAVNLEFHKLHYSYSELKKAFLLDKYIQLFSIFVSLSLITLSLRNLKIPEDTQFAFLYSPLFIFAIMILGLSNPNPIINGKKKYSLFDSFKINGLILVSIYGVLSTISSMSLSYLFLEHGLSLMILAVSTGVGFVIYSSRYQLRMVFHQAKSISAYGKIVPTFGKSVAMGLGLYGVVVLGTLPFIKFDLSSLGVKAIAIQVAGPFSPALDNLVAKDIVKAHRKTPTVLKSIVLNSPELGQVPISELLPNPKMSEYVVYLTYVNNPSTANLTYIMSNPIPKTDKNKRWYPALNKLIVDKWPTTQEFPKHLLAQELVAEERAPASAKKQNP